MKVDDANLTRRNTAHFVRVIRSELSSLQIRYLVTRCITALLPTYVANRLRSRCWRGLGWDIGPEAVLLAGLNLSGTGAIRHRLHIGAGAWLNEGCRIELNDSVTIGDNAALGHDVLILTSTHRLGRHARRASELTTAPVEIGAGAWIGARSVVLPGVTIGAGAVVSAGSVVSKDVPADVVVAGVPARVIVNRIPG